ncbi:MAG: hypothetical protein MSB10_07285 [Clostridiales bacterium]|uniref:hypothetical protein n=1 Tax=Flavonifractor porci TaxID=3133422 RepID=UPI0030B01918|nr:hypothetical protein [Clostridiales bacterium]
MERRLTAGADLLTRIMLGLTLALLLGGMVLGVGQNRESWKALMLAALILIVCWKELPRLCHWLERLGAVRIWLVLTLLCLAVKGAWVLLVRITPSGDYATFRGYANALAQQPVLEGGRYMALFPHIFGYSSFLSWFIRLLGPGELLAQVLNVVLTGVSGSFLFLLGRRWWGLPAGISGYLLWIACPSQTIYNSLVLSEPLYTTLMLGALVLLTAGEGGRPILRGAATGLVLRWFNGVRPIAAVVIIALLIWRLVLKPEEWLLGESRRYWLGLLATLLAVYAITGPLWQAHLTRRIGEEPSTTPGYSVLVGFNQNSGGAWNWEDSNLLFSLSDAPGTTAQQAQEGALKAAKDRITSGEVELLPLMGDKLRAFLGSDHACVGYVGSVVRHTKLFALACNGFYYAILMLAGAGLARLWRNRERFALVLLPLYVLGLTCAQMLVEVAGRYHYSILPVLLLLGQVALFRPVPEKTKKFSKKPGKLLTGHGF